MNDTQSPCSAPDQPPAPGPLESLFEQAFHQSPDPIILTRVRDGCYVEANAAAQAFLGYRRDEIIGRTSLELGVWVDPGERDRLGRLLREAGEVSGFEVRFRRKDGTERTGLVSAAIITFGDEPHLLSTTRDITEHKREEAVRRESQQLLVNLARLVPGVIYQYRLYPDGRSAFPYSSPGMELIYEVLPEEVREDATPVFGRLHPDDAARVAAAIFESAERLTTFYCEFRVVLPRQGLRWRWSQAQPERTPDGGTLWHGIILDVTDRKAVEQQNSALEAQLRQAQKMESVGRLAGGVAHDFNNMLGVILGHAEMALAQIKPSDPLRDDLDEIHRAARRSAELTRQLLAFARRQTIAPQVLDLSDTVRGMAAMLRRLIGEDIRLEVAPGPGLWPVKVDPSQIDQLLANLCVNARDAISGVGHVRIALDNVTIDPDSSSRRPGMLPGDFVRVSVTDDGCGMTEDVLSRLFEPFFTTKGLGKGTGLGLATVYGIVKQNEGFITVDSEPGRGTTMAAHFPRHTSGTPVASDDSRDGGVAGGTETVLLVEDEPAMLTMATIVLEGLGYTVLPAATPAAAVRIAASHASRIDLLITDVIMPDMNGRDLAALLLARYPGLKHLFMSGYTADVIAPQGILEDGVPFIQKPFSRLSLATKVREVLDRT